jgi:RNA polymerase-binding transcription factor DksA
MVTCERCGTSYTEKEYAKLEKTGHNIVWNFDYRRCEKCGAEITPLKTNITAKIGDW